MHRPINPRARGPVQAVVELKAAQSGNTCGVSRTDDKACFSNLTLKSEVAGRVVWRG